MRFPTLGACLVPLLFAACAPEGGAPDASVIDASMIDASVIDASVSDASATDASASDASMSDATMEDGGAFDASAPDASLGGATLAELVSPALFDAMFLHRATAPCRGAFYTYAAFLDAAATFPAFASEGDDATRRREVAAFLANLGHETTGGWPTAPDGPYAWGLCWITEGATVEPAALPDYCAPSADWPCAPGEKYFGRGPIQLSWNYNYGQCGAALGLPLLADPGLVARDPAIAFRTALWFWMTPQAPKPSCHDVMTGRYIPSATDLDAGRVAGFGLTVNIINGGLECGRVADARVADRIGYFERFTALLGTDPGANLDCATMRSY